MTAARKPPGIRLRHEPIDLVLRETWGTAHGASATRTNVLVSLACGGVVGLGEAAPSALLGEDAASVSAALDRIARRLDREREPTAALIERLPAILPGERAARAALDIALHDWLGRRRRVPAGRLLGVGPGPSPPTSYSVGLDSLEVMRDKARRAAAFPILKSKVDAGRAREIVAAIRADTERPLRVDGNEAWRDPEEAIRAILWMETRGVVLVEQPLPAGDLDGARRVRDRIGIPLIADESARDPEDVARLAGCFDGVNVKVQKCGGLLPARRMIDEARGRGLQVMLGCMIETGLGIAAAAHLAPLVDHVDLDGHLLIARDPFRGLNVRAGRLVLPRRSGIGVERVRAAGRGTPRRGRSRG